jgi:hypothetical protein
MKVVRILVIGGCHCNGLPVGEENGFVAQAGLALRAAGTAAEFRVEAPVALRRAAEIVARRRGESYDAVIVQLGNYEATGLLKKWLRARGGWLPRTASSSGMPQSSGGLLREPHITLGTKVRMLANRVGDRLSGHTLVRVGEITPRFEYNLSLLAEAFGPQTVVLSPTPCVDPVYLRYRIELHRIMERKCREVKLPYVDVIGALAGDPEMFSDHVHLGRKGHRQLGILVAAALRRVLPARTVAV